MKMLRVLSGKSPSSKVNLRRHAEQVAEEKFCSLFDAWTDGARRLVVSKMERREQFKELSLLWARGAKLCLTIIGPSRARNNMLERMQASAIRHIEMAGELATLQTAVSSAAESVLGRSPSDTFRVEVVGELVIEFKKMKVWRSRLERPTTRVCDLLLGPPPGRAWLGDHLDEAAG
jgi:hypothetical protein